MNVRSRVVVALALLAPGVLGAQQPGDAAERRVIELRSGGPGTIVGIVVDTSGMPIENVDIVIPALSRGTRTDGDGTFRLAELDSGTYVLQARRIGFRPLARRVVVGDRGATVGFVLEHAPYRLPPQLVASTRTGLSGVVMDTSVQGLSGARVYAVSSGERTTTDSAGAFFLPLKAGRYIVTVNRAGHVPAHFGVTIPRGEGRHVEVWLHEGSRGAQARHAANMHGLRERLIRRSAAYSRVFSREDLIAHPLGDVALALGAGAAHVISPNCEAIVDGGPKRVEIWAILPEEVEFAEVYTPRPARARSTSIRAGPRPRSSAGMLPDNRGCPGIFVWLRQ